MEFLGQFHPQIIHTPIVLIIVSLVLDLVGRATDSAWWRKASMLLLVLGVIGAAAAILSGEPASERAEKRQGIPEAVVESHEDMGKIAGWLAAGALAARLVENGVGSARMLVGVLALLLHLGSAVTVAVAAHRGGMLVYTHGANVTIGGQLIREPGAPPGEGGSSDAEGHEGHEEHAPEHDGK